MATAIAATFCSVGFAVVSFIRAVDSAQPIVQAILLPLYFISGVFVPQDQIPTWMANIANIFPVRHLATPLPLNFYPLGGKRRSGYFEFCREAWYLMAPGVDATPQSRILPRVHAMGCVQSRGLSRQGDLGRGASFRRPTS